MCLFVQKYDLQAPEQKLGVITMLRSVLLVSILRILAVPAYSDDKVSMAIQGFGFSE